MNISALFCWISTLLGLLTAVPLKSASGDLGNGKYLNPILAGDYPDPSVVRDGDDYYMTHSSFDYQPGLIVFHSKDLVNWEPISFALKNYLGSVWAPDIAKHHGRYYIYFTVAHQQGTKNYVVHADNPKGPWSEPTDIEADGKIDPGYIQSEDGSQWIFLSGGYRGRLTENGLRIVKGTIEKVFEAWPIPNEWVTEGIALEGPKLRRVGEYFYYVSAQGGTAGPPTSHMAIVARSKSINGPWEVSPYNPFIHTWENSDRWWSKGHASLIDTPDGKWWVVYHAYENGFYTLGRQTLLEPVTWTKNGWPIVKSDVEKSIRKPNMQIKVGTDRKINLKHFRIGFDWKFYKQYEPERFRVVGNTLTMLGRGTTPGGSHPLLFVSGDHAFEMSVEIELKGDVSAGIILQYDSAMNAGVGFNNEERFRIRRGSVGYRKAHPEPSNNVLHLRMKSFNNIVTCYYSYNNRDWMKEEWGLEVSAYHHNAFGQFQSLLPGLFVCGEGEAVFRNFSYDK